MTPQSTPVNLDLKRDEKLDITWADGHRSTYSITLLRTMCPCALCKTVREGKDPHSLMQPVEQPTPPGVKRTKVSLGILPGNFSEPLRVLSAELVGNYALRLDWSDQHGSGIYSFDYLREIDNT